ncbi:MAG: 4-hydroxy-tetrahydrodipicolinate reductase [Hadesarchaea archaeon DG-33]|nr:MAG: 4-hydroxy-tetrahydrodipicolinate reductase [Hadesarchaea archaeon DG-33]
MIRVAVCGACGRMGRLIVHQVAKQADMELVAAIDAHGTPSAGEDAGKLAGVGELGVKIVGADKLAETLKRLNPDVLVDFTTADATVQNVKTASQTGVSVVVGTTGFTAEQRVEMEEAVKKGKIRAIISPNMSIGVNVFFKSAKETARMLGSDYGVEIVEAHHVHKRDAPSGTARRIAHIIAREFNWSEDKIKIKSIREGEIVGEHTVIFSTPEERVEIIHRAQSRETFAAGAMKAIRYVVEKGKPGVVEDMQNVLGL